MPQLLVTYNVVVVSKHIVLAAVAPRNRHDTIDSRAQNSHTVAVVVHPRHNDIHFDIHSLNTYICLDGEHVKLLVKEHYDIYLKGEKPTYHI